MLIARRLEFRGTVLAGAGLAALGALGLRDLRRVARPTGRACSSWALMGLGIGPALSGLQIALQRSVRPEQIGGAMGTLLLLRQVGGAVALASAETVYRAGARPRAVVDRHRRADDRPARLADRRARAALAPARRRAGCPRRRWREPRCSRARDRQPPGRRGQPLQLARTRVEDFSEFLRYEADDRLCHGRDLRLQLGRHVLGRHAVRARAIGVGAGSAAACCAPPRPRRSSGAATSSRWTRTPSRRRASRQARLRAGLHAPRLPHRARETAPS